MADDDYIRCNEMSAAHGGTFVVFPDGCRRRVSWDTYSAMPDNKTWQNYRGFFESKESLLAAYEGLLQHDKDNLAHGTADKRGGNVATAVGEPPAIAAVGALQISTPVRACYAVVYPMTHRTDREGLDEVLREESYISESVGYLAEDTVKAIALSSTLTAGPARYSIVIPRQSLVVLRPLRET